GAAVDGIAANPDARRDTDTERLHLRGRFIAKRARARDDADVARHVDVPWHDPQHRLAGADHTGAVGSDQPGATLLGIAPQVPLDPHHVLGGHAVGNRHDEPDTCVGCLHNGVGAERGRDEDERGGGPGGRDGFLDGVEDRALEMGRTALPRGHAADDVRAVGDHLVGVERALVAREALDDDGGALIEQDAHTGSDALALEVLTPCPPLPAGEGGLRTFLSESTRRNAAATRSGEAPPPISRKLAGSPPACLIMSIVAIASPAPLMMQPMSPSRAT